VPITPSVLEIKTTIPMLKLETVNDDSDYEYNGDDADFKEEI
jgi:hypothetical protein